MIAAGAVQVHTGVVLDGDAPFRSGVVDDEFAVEHIAGSGAGFVIHDADELRVQHGDGRIAGPGAIGAMVRAVVIIAQKVGGDGFVAGGRGALLDLGVNDHAGEAVGGVIHDGGLPRAAIGQAGQGDGKGCGGTEFVFDF